MPLQGTFDVLDFGEVLRLLAEHQMTGRLYVRHRSFGANLFLESGLLIGADQSEHQPAAAIGDVAGRLEEVCFEMLEADRGSFEFHPGRPSTLPVANRHAVDDVLARARKRLDEWRELQEAIPSLDLQPKLVLEMVRPQVVLDQERWRMLTAIDGRRNLRAIGRVVNLSDFDVCRVVRSLVEDGIVELDGLAALSASSRDAMPVVPPREPTPGGTSTPTAPPGPDDEPDGTPGTAGADDHDPDDDADRTPPRGVEMVRVIDEAQESVTVTRPGPDAPDRPDASRPDASRPDASRADGAAPGGEPPPVTEERARSARQLAADGARSRLVRIRSRRAGANPRTV